MKKNILKKIGSTCFGLALSASSLSAVGAAPSYYRTRQGAYSGGHQSYLAETGRIPFLSELEKENATKLEQGLQLRKKQALSGFDHSVGVKIRELLIVDGAVQDKHLLLKQARPGVDIVEIAQDGNGIAQLFEILSRYKNLEAVHLVSHAEPGKLHIGGQVLGTKELENNLNAFTSINNAIKTNGDFLLYGCELAKDAAGEQFLETIKGNTHVDVAASNDNTGNVEYLGDWDLEVQKGDITTAPLAESIAMKDFTGVLQTFSMNWGDIVESGYYSGTENNAQVNEYGGGSSHTLTIDGTSDGTYANGTYIYLGGGGASYESGVTLSLDGGKLFDPTSLYMYSSVPTTLTFTSDVSGSTAQSFSGLNGFTIDLSALAANTSRISITSTTNFAGHLDEVVFSNIISVNDEPSFTKGANESVLEDAGAQTINTWATSLDKGATNESGQTLSFGVTNDNNALFSSQPAIDANGNLTYTPATDASGVTTVSVILSDDGGTSDGGDDTFATQTFTITVGAVNDEPSFAKGANESVLEDAGAQTINTWATSLDKGATNESGQTLSFGVTNDNNALFSSQPAIDANGNLSYTPAADASGLAIINVVLSDDGGTSDGGDDTFTTQTFTITVGAVNDEPSFAKGANESVLEDAGAQTINTWATSLDKGAVDESGQSLTFTVTNDNNALFSSQPAIDANGNLSYTPAADASGSATVSVVLSDDGGTSDGGDDTFETETFTITVGAVNDEPSFAKGANESVLEDAGAQTINTWATSLDKGATNESGQTLSFGVTNDNNALFSSQPAIDVNGNLTYTTAADASGSATVSVVLSDDGGTSDGGDDTFETQTFTITISNIYAISLTVQGESDESTIETNGGTLQLEVTVLPVNTTDNSITWSVTDGTGSATIDENGLLTAVTDGTVTVTVYSNDGSTIEGTTEIIISNQLTTGLSNSSLANRFNIYPNPVAKEINIESHGIEIGEVSILDIKGNLIKTFPSNENINVSDLEKGVYILRIQYENNIINKRFIKE
jgi:hypothetical protein